MNRFSEALQDFRPSALGPVREREILRVAGLLPKANMDDVRRQILLWAKNRTPTDLPEEAWQGKNFELLSGGRSIHVETLESAQGNLWTFRNDDPDKTVAGRVWTTEVTIGSIDFQDLLLSIRQIVSSAEGELYIDPHVPGPVLQISERFTMYAGSERISKLSKKVTSRSDLDELISLLENPKRRLPVVIASGDERAVDPGMPLVDIAKIARAVCGLAHCFTLPADFSYGLSDAFGRSRSVFHGGVRLYLPGFNSESRPLEHQLFLAQTLTDEPGRDLCESSIRQLVARLSLSRNRLGREIVTFASIKSAASRGVVPLKDNDLTDDAISITAIRSQLSAMEEELAQAKDWEAQLTNLHDEMEERARSAEAQASSHAFQIQWLLEKLESKGESPDTDLIMPSDWSELGDWIDENLAGRLVLTPSARRSLKKAVYQNAEIVGRCLLWLASECRVRRRNGGGSIADEVVADGIRNSSCGGDTFVFDFHSQRLKADWHIKNGGNTRDPTKCLRIYYGWDASSSQIVVAALPAHIRTSAT